MLSALFKILLTYRYLFYIIVLLSLLLLHFYLFCQSCKLTLRFVLIGNFVILVIKMYSLQRITNLQVFCFKFKTNVYFKC